MGDGGGLGLKNAEQHGICPTCPQYSECSLGTVHLGLCLWAMVGGEMDTLHGGHEPIVAGSPTSGSQRVSWWDFPQGCPDLGSSEQVAGYSMV